MWRDPMFYLLVFATVAFAIFVAMLVLWPI
jgi:hypothetical protein